MDGHARHLESLAVGFKFFFRPRQSRKEPVQFELPVKTISPTVRFKALYPCVHKSGFSPPRSRPALEFTYDPGLTVRDSAGSRRDLAHQPF